MTLHQRVASLFARRWANHERRDFSASRFAEFAGVLREEMPGYHSLGILDADRRIVHQLPSGSEILAAAQRPEHEAVIEKARQDNKATLSAPFEISAGATALFLALPLVRGEEFLGYFVAGFFADTLLDDCFHQRIRSRFSFRLDEQEKNIFSSPPRVEEFVPGAGEFVSQASLSVADRSWNLKMNPRPETTAAYGWKASLAVLLLGASFPLGFAVLVYLLVRRIEMLRVSRDQQVQLARKILAAQEEERARISRELHDELGQQLTALRLEMGWLQKKIGLDAKSEELFRNGVLLVGQATEELRRMCRGLRPPALDDLGLEPAARSLLDDFRARSGCQVEARIRIAADRLPPPLVLCAYRILQESLNNITRHAQARRVEIRLEQNAGLLELEIRDDGRGFDTRGLGSQRGWGLQGMRERATLAGGRLEVDSTPGRGTRVTFRAPTGAGAKEGR